MALFQPLRQVQNELLDTFRILIELHRARDAFAFLHVDHLVRLYIFQAIDLPARPSDFKRIDLLRLAQTKMNPQIALRKVPAAAANLVDLAMRL